MEVENIVPEIKGERKMNDKDMVVASCENPVPEH